jgi:hypothetical protein
MSYPGGHGWQDQPQQPYQPNTQGETYQPYEGYQPQQQFYGGPPTGSPPLGPGKNGTGFWIGVGALVLVVAAGVTLAFVAPAHKVDGVAQAAPLVATSAPVVPSPSSPNPSTGTTPPNPAAGNKVASITPGWQGILSTKDNVAYDLPPDGWDTRPGFISGYDSGSVKATIHESSTYKTGACPDVDGSNRGKAGFMAAGDNAVDVAARGSVRLWAQAAATGDDGKVPDVPLPPTTQIPIDGGKLQATSSTVTFTPPASEGCRAPSVQVTSAAFKVGTQTVCFLLVLDQQVPDALPAEDAQKILASLRPNQP